jgi:hypothetical protein
VGLQKKARKLSRTRNMNNLIESSLGIDCSMFGKGRGLSVELLLLLLLLITQQMLACLQPVHQSAAATVAQSTICM